MRFLAALAVVTAIASLVLWNHRSHGPRRVCPPPPAPRPEATGGPTPGLRGRASAEERDAPRLRQLRLKLENALGAADPFGEFLVWEQHLVILSLLRESERGVDGPSAWEGWAEPLRTIRRLLLKRRDLGSLLAYLREEADEQNLGKFSAILAHTEVAGLYGPELRMLFGTPYPHVRANGLKGLARARLATCADISAVADALTMSGRGALLPMLHGIHAAVTRGACPSLPANAVERLRTLVESVAVEERVRALALLCLGISGHVSSAAVLRIWEGARLAPLSKACILTLARIAPNSLLDLYAGADARTRRWILDEAIPILAGRPDWCSAAEELAAIALSDADSGVRLGGALGTLRYALDQQERSMLITRETLKSGTQYDQIDVLSLLRAKPNLRFRHLDLLPALLKSPSVWVVDEAKRLLQEK